ncbi:TIGR00725 family protein [Desulfonema ishimotonii]|uniref:TIGR00725 family protein n=1 Tax=Desulfonema ishimotonii TaxID=45657 RepID=A0A401FSX6_9BACT|nr:TIGR00725 family protein [Desulfonema ishimotonii]GBC60082.1 TIGR00725 family protein [Desulfonema ishimotonii]
MKRAFIVGVMGGGSAPEKDLRAARRLGRLIASQGWVLLNGGRNAGIMEASARGACEAGGVTLGILPDASDHQVSEYIQIPVLTGMGSARNSINVLSSHVVVACPGGTGTLSEIALALKAGRPVILMGFDAERIFDAHAKAGQLHYAETPEDAIERIKALYP